jgi:hypothetical protein
MAQLTSSIIGLIDQPEKAAKDSPVDVFILDLYGEGFFSPTLTYNAVAESLVISAALPDGWNVNMASYIVEEDLYQNYIDFVNIDFGNMPDIITITDTIGMITKLKASLASPQSASPISDFDDDIKNNYPVGSRALSSFVALNVINMPSGTPADTLVDIPDSLNPGFLPPQINIKAAGILIHLNVITGPVNGEFNLGYFAGFNPYRIGATSLLPVNDFSDSNMIQITDDLIERMPRQAGMGELDLEVSPNPFIPGARLSVFLPDRFLGRQGILSLVDPNGRVINARPLDFEAGWNTAPWRSTFGNNPISNGVYVIRLRVGDNRVSRKILVTR